MKILIIDDDPSIRELLDTVIQTIGDHQTAFAESGDEGLKELARFRPDLVICDLMLPGVTGTEILRLVHEAPDFASTPFIMVSGSRFDPSFADIMMQHPNVRAFLGKPFSLEDIRAAVENISPAAFDMAASQPIAQAQKARTPLKVMVVEDNPESLQMINMAIHRDDIVRHTTNTKEALQIIKQFLPNIIIVKMVMAGMSGIELLRVLSEDSKLCQIPVLLSVGGSLAGDEVAILKKEFPGLWWVMNRPFTTEALRNLLQSLATPSCDLA